MTRATTDRTDVLYLKTLENILLSYWVARKIVARYAFTFHAKHNNLQEASKLLLKYVISGTQILQFSKTLRSKHQNIRFEFLKQWNLNLSFLDNCISISSLLFYLNT